MAVSPRSLANLRIKPFTKDNARLYAARSVQARAKKANAREFYRAIAKRKVNHARVADIERRLAVLEQFMAQATKPVRKSAKPRPAVGDDIPTLAKPPAKPEIPGP